MKYGFLVLSVGLLALGLNGAREDFVVYFNPMTTTEVALSPDGRYLAYSQRVGEELTVAVIEIDKPGQMVSRITVATDRMSSPVMDQHSAEKVPAHISWMGWVTDTRLVVETNQNFAKSTKEGWQNIPGAIIAVDADGGNGKTLATPETVSRQVFATPQVRNNRRIEPGMTPAGESFRAPGQAFGIEDPFGLIFPGDDSEMGNPVIQGVANFSTVYRRPQVFDYSPETKGGLLITAGESNRYELIEIDVANGKKRILVDEVIGESLQPLMDRNGRSRVTVHNTMRTPFPHVYQYDAGGLFGWKPLDGLLDFGDGAGFSVGPENFFGERAIPVGFDRDPDHLLYASNHGRDTFGIYRLDLKTGTRLGVLLEDEELDMVAPPASGFPPEENLVYDRYMRRLVGVRVKGIFQRTFWMDMQLQSIQKKLEGTFRKRSVEILEWTSGRSRFLVHVYSPVDPGAYLIYDRNTDKLTEFVRASPTLPEKQVPYLIDFEFEAKEGHRVRGIMVAPRQLKDPRAPVVLMCPAFPWEPVSPAYDAEMLAFAQMGFVAVKVEGRGAWGRGIWYREAIHEGYDRVQIDDLYAAVEHLKATYRIHPHKVALYGEAHGGYVALRALQLYPKQFRAAIAIEPPVNLEDWLQRQRWTTGSSRLAMMKSYFGDDHLRAAAELVNEPQKVTNANMILSYRGVGDATPSTVFHGAIQLSAAIRRAGGNSKFVELERDYMNGLPMAVSEVFHQIHEFLNTELYDYAVEAGEIEVIE